MPASLRYIGILLRTGWQCVRTKPAIYIILVIACIVVSASVMPHDRALLDLIRQNPETSPGIHKLGRTISHYSMYGYTPLLLCTVIWVVGWLRRKIDLKRVALVCFVAATMAGLVVNIFRPGLGRPRPRADMEDRFYYMQIRNSDMHSHPSGHTMSNVGGATALLIIKPWVGVPYFIFSLASGWSRMQVNAHYPADVFVGILGGVAIGLAYARAYRIIPIDQDPLEKEPESGTSASGQSSDPPRE